MALHLSLAWNHFGLCYVLLYNLMEDQKYLLLGVEALLALSLYLAWRLVRSFLRPIAQINQGTDAILDKEFHHQLPEGKGKQMKKLASAYNGMMHQIREERIQLQEQHFFLEKLIEASPSGIILLDYDDFITYINPAAKQLLGLSEEHLQKPLKEIGHDFIEEIGALKLGESQIVSLHGLRQYKCQLAQFLHRGFNRKFLLIEELSKELLATEKRAYGKVIRMMAHEVNNSIGAINSILHSVRDIEEESKSTDSEQIVSALDIAIDRNDRLNQFMRNFADVIRLPEPRKAAIELNEALQKVAGLFQQQAEQREIQIELDLHKGPLPVLLDIAQMEQVWVNIMKNAMDSIEAYGKIRIVTTARPLQIIIADNGDGIPPDAARKLFTPFFSTKPHGQGIGLTIIREILSNHQIDFSLETKPTGWTEFEMVLG